MLLSKILFVLKYEENLKELEKINFLKRLKKSLSLLESEIPVTWLKEHTIQRNFNHNSSNNIECSLTVDDVLHLIEL